MFSILGLLQLSAALSVGQLDTTSEAQRTSVIALPIRPHFESFVTGLPAPRPLSPEMVLGIETPVDTPRTVAIEYSDWYYKRLTIHRYASYATIPLFILQYASGQNLMNHPGEGSWARDVHGPVAASIAVLFGVNTVTGVWNLYDSRKDPNGRTRRTVHSLLMLAADAGFVWTGAIAPGDDEGGGGGDSSQARRHRTVAITSGSVALASYLMMLIWKD